MSPKHLHHFTTRLLPALLLLSFPILPRAQQIGSFFTAIQYNGAVPDGHAACNGMTGSYCCASSQSCAWDDAGHVACCASGSTCAGSPYQGDYAGAKYDQGQGQGQYAGAGAGAGAGGGGGGGQCNTCQQACNTCGQQTTTVYQQQSWQPTPTSTYAAVAPVTTYQSYTSNLPTTTEVPTQTTVAGVAAGGVAVTTEVGVNQACGAGGYTTLVKANVGAPVRTVGCYVIIDEGGRRGVGRWVWWAVTGVMVGMGWRECWWC